MAFCVAALLILGSSSSFGHSAPPTAAAPGNARPVAHSVFPHPSLQAPSPKITLSYFQEHFIVREGTASESAPLKLARQTPKLSTLFRRNSTFAVWDERGLTIRVGSKVKSSKLPDVSTSPKAFSRDEIIDTLNDIRRGNRSKLVAGLSGALRVGNRVYFLGRWEDKAGKPWAEALVQVDLTQKFPEPRLAGRVEAMSLADQPIDDRLFVLDGRVTYVARTKDRWGIEQYDPRTNRFSFDQMGDQLESYVQLEDAATHKLQVASHLLGIVEHTAYGTTIAGRIDLKARTRKVLVECRGKMRFIDNELPECLVLSAGKATLIIDAATGAQMNLPGPCATRRTSRGVVIWTPIDAPKKAWLYDPRRWQGRAWWNADLSQDN